MESAPFFVLSTSFCSLSSWFTSSCAYHLITVTSLALMHHLSLHRPFIWDLIKLISFTNIGVCGEHREIIVEDFRPMWLRYVNATRQAVIYRQKQSSTTTAQMWRIMTTVNLHGVFFKQGKFADLQAGGCVLAGLALSQRKDAALVEDILSDEGTRQSANDMLLLVIGECWLWNGRYPRLNSRLSSPRN